ncbi:ornithine cyclodeaminase family protein [Fulvivirgaceae bacterium PWU4]|uniref:Ornithine cyclodeaminase family protein n=1 Tax=Chryseosolibacter histidini TaxID=2782349 RepID=A0AAP2DND6_9BACT|nr:ornithine cyclodeaminase family protein [Chryseosolibacter histidini]MBT1699545.1 ornithine cyclodeaminase family protein [Chryseosolibacter histidini]
METLLLGRKDVRALLTIDECIAGVEQAFKLRALGKAQAPGVLGVHAHDGGFHIKAGILTLGRAYFVTKTNANFPDNMKRHGLPTIQGVVVVSDAQNGALLALLDSIEITIIRTGAATAVAAKYLSNPEAKTVTICGCGNQGRISLKALLAVRTIERVFAYDQDEAIAQRFSETLGHELNVDIEAVADFKAALAKSDICITCTPSKKPFISRNDIRPGTFIAAVGSDNDNKQELEAGLLAGNKVIADSIDQASKIGELHHALDDGVMKIGDVYAELGEIIAGLKPGRISKDEIIIFDSTGTALQDVAAAAVVYEKAIERSLGARLNFAD